jgi:cobalt/nickel transport system permease protein
MYLDRLELKHDCLAGFPFNGIDPRCRVAAGAACILSVVSLSRWYVLAAVIVALLAPAVLAGETRTVLRRLIPVNLFCLVLWLTIPLNTWVAAAAAAAPAAEAPAAAALRYTLRINAAALVYMLFIVPLGIGGLANVLMKCGVPGKLVALLILTYRYIFLLYGRLSTALSSMAQRRPQQNTLTVWRSYTAVFASSLAAALFRSARIEAAMRERGFDGVFPVTAGFAWKARDTVWLLVFLGLAAAAAVLSHGG